MKILGFDPGGIDRFGCAVLDSDDGTIDVFCAKSVDDAIEWSKTRLDGEAPEAAGIDTLLFWQSTPSGWRGADLYLRKRYPGSRNSVLSANGLYGSMAVQGAVLAHRLRTVWPGVELTETHPKVLWAHLCPDIPYPRGWLPDNPARDWLFSKGLSALHVSTEDQFDALLSAWAAWQAAIGRWTMDLQQIAAPSQVAPNVLLTDDVHFYWPD